MATGDLVPAAEYHESDDGEDIIPEEEQSEIGTEDEDAPQADGWDDDPFDRPDQSLSPSGGDTGDSEAVENLEPFRIVVDGDTCCFERPEWWNCSAITTPGKSFVADSERKFRMMSAIAEWLSKYRKDFLRDPDPWLLGVSALEEFMEGWSSVVQKDFLVHAELRPFAGSDLFSRNIRNTDLVYEDGNVPLVFLFDDDARMAWVARVVMGLASDAGRKMKDVLKTYADVTVPKGKKADFAKAPPASLDFGGLIAKACAMAGHNQAIGWTDVIKRFGGRMI
jgi:hypothetical protein